MNEPIQIAGPILTSRTVDEHCGMPVTTLASPWHGSVTTDAVPVEGVRLETCSCHHERDWGICLCQVHLRERIAALEEPVAIGSDGMCRCNGATRCPLGKTGSALRCTESQLIESGVPTSFIGR